MNPAIASILGASAENSALAHLVENVLDVWPEHAKFLARTMSGRSAEEISDSFSLAELVRRIADQDLGIICQNYRWLCEEFISESLHFVQTGAYRFSKLSEVESFVYQNPDFMKRYMDGLLLSQVFWVNHFRASNFLLRRYLPGLGQGARHLEVGPGHGLFLYYASQCQNVKSLSAWDISPTSLALSERCLEKLQVASRVDFKLRDVAAQAGSATFFDSIVLSEVLEHVEKPKSLLESVSSLLSDSGRIFINVPVNSPAPDHIYLLESPEAAVDLVASTGLRIIDSAFFPETGVTIEQARKRKATVTCIIVAQK